VDNVRAAGIHPLTSNRSAAPLAMVRLLSLRIEQGPGHRRVPVSG
jgi:hypothetical protein